MMNDKYVDIELNEEGKVDEKATVEGFKKETIFTKTKNAIAKHGAKVAIGGIVVGGIVWGIVKAVKGKGNSAVPASNVIEFDAPKMFEDTTEIIQEITEE